MTTSTKTVPLFSYGTLQDKEVQLATFGRELTGRADTLPGYTRTAIFSGESHYLNLKPASNPADVVPGTVFEITEEDLAAADEYEADADYRRILVTLGSGDQAWVYLQM